MRLSLAVLLSDALAAPAFAADEPVSTMPGSPAVAATAAAPAKNDGDVKVCRIVKEIGSNRAQRVCRTKAQIQAESNAARDLLSGPQGEKRM